MTRADANADPDWKSRVDTAIAKLASYGEEFTAEDVRKIVGDPPAGTSPNAMGPRFLAAALRGVIASSGYRKSNRTSLHRHPIRVWVGTAASAREWVS